MPDQCAGKNKPDIKVKIKDVYSKNKEKIIKDKKIKIKIMETEALREKP